MDLIFRLGIWYYKRSKERKKVLLEVRFDYWGSEGYLGSRFIILKNLVVLKL
jgi:hypothetical protein